MVDEGTVHEEEGEPVVSAAETIRMLDRYEESTRALAWAVMARASEPSERDSLTDTEMQFAALEIYQSDTMNDGIASLFYNSLEFIPAMLEGTKRTGARIARDILIRGLEALGLSADADVSEIANSGVELLAAMEEAEPTQVEADRLLNEFEVLQDEFDNKIGNLADEMALLLRLYASDFKNFP